MDVIDKPMTKDKQNQEIKHWSETRKNIQEAHPIFEPKEGKEKVFIKCKECLNVSPVIDGKYIIFHDKNCSEEKTQAFKGPAPDSDSNEKCNWCGELFDRKIGHQSYKPKFHSIHPFYPLESRGDWEERFVEAGANIEHDRWARWQKYMFSKCQRLNGGVLTIPEELVKRWFRQIETPYSDLSEEEKESDRKETRNYLPLIRELLTLAHTEGIEEGKKETWREILESLELGDVKTIYSQTKETKNNE